MFLEVSQKRLPHLFSDHFSILLENGRFGGGKKPFCFENMWLKEDGFVEKVGECWRSYAFAGSPSFVLDAKLRVLKKDIIKWNREVFGDRKS